MLWFKRRAKAAKWRDSAAKCILLHTISTVMFDSSVFRSYEPMFTATNTHTLNHLYMVRASTLSPELSECLCVFYKYTARKVHKSMKLVESSSVCIVSLAVYVLSFVLITSLHMFRPIQCADNVCTERIARSLSHLTAPLFF